MIRTILLTGGTGLIGNKLTEELILKGYKIHLLVRKVPEHIRDGVKIFQWDVYKRIIDSECIIGVDAIIHLAGENIGSQRWTEKRKQQIMWSRTESIRMIYELLRSNNHHVKHVISASAVGYYGNRGNDILTEDTAPANDFLAKTCLEWERAVDEGIELGLRIVKLRSGIVLDPREGALSQLSRSFKFNVGTVLGSGNQWLAWIHISDVLRMYIFALENENIKGAYNMVAPDTVTNKTFNHELAKEMKKSVLSLHVPEFVLKLLMGEMSILALGSSRTSADKIISAGFKFKYPQLKSALSNIYKDPQFLSK